MTAAKEDFRLGCGRADFRLESKEIRRQDVWRYLGYRGSVPDAAVREAVEEAIEKLLPVLEARAVYRFFPLEIIQAEEPFLSFAGIRTKSRDLSKNLSGCHEVILFAATLGPGPDRLIRRAEVSHISEAVILQAVAADAIELVCDRLNEKLRLLAAREGCVLRPRYSPGYGDFPLEVQREFLQVLSAGKEIGLTLTEGLLMAPSKSVTAVIGVGREREAAESED